MASLVLVIALRQGVYKTLDWRTDHAVCTQAQVRGCNQKFPDRVDNEINNSNNKHSLRSNTKCYGVKTHYTDSQNSDTTAPSGRELYHLHFWLQEASPETFGYTLVEYLLVSKVQVTHTIQI
jgi:hypothetical protein